MFLSLKDLNLTFFIQSHWNGFYSVYDWYDQNLIFTDLKESSLSQINLLWNIIIRLLARLFLRKCPGVYFFYFFFFEWEMFSRFIGLRSFTIFSIKILFFIVKSEALFIPWFDFVWIAVLCFVTDILYKMLFWSRRPRK